MDDVSGQLEDEVGVKEGLERDTRALQMELQSLRSMEKTYNKLEKAKRRLEDEFNAYKVIVYIQCNSVKYIVACQRGGVSDETPWLRAALRHGPGTLKSVNRWTKHTDRLLKI